jgi:cytoskeletal protein RodZ
LAVFPKKLIVQGEFMKNVILVMAAMAGLFMAQAALAQAPAGSTGLCKDGTYTSAASKSGACHGHQGVKTWLAADTGTTSSKSSAKSKASSTEKPTSKTAEPAAAPAAAAAPAPAAAAAPAPAKPAKTSTHTSTASMTQAAGGGAGMVWLNSSSNVYHCQGSSYYGKTKEGSYMTEAQAKAKGAHADHNKPCSK